MKKRIAVSELPAECRRRRRGVLPSEAKSFEYWQVRGMSWKGRHTKRDGKMVTCGHEHRTKEACARCLKKMQKERPGNAQTYQAVHVKGFLVGYKIPQHRSTACP